MSANVKVNTQRIGPYSKGEVPLTLQHTYQDVDGNAVDLTVFDSVTLRLDRLASDGETWDTVAPGGAADFVSGSQAAGVVEYAWGAGDLTTAGYHRVQFWVPDAAAPYKLASDVFTFWVEDLTEAP